MPFHVSIYCGERNNQDSGGDIKSCSSVKQKKDRMCLFCLPARETFQEIKHFDQESNEQLRAEMWLQVSADVARLKDIFLPVWFKGMVCFS